VSDSNVIKLAQPGAFTDSLTEILRSGARALLTQAVEAEVAEFLSKHADLKTETGRQRVVRHGHLPEREIMTGIGPVAVRQPRVRDREAADRGRIPDALALEEEYDDIVTKGQPLDNDGKGVPAQIGVLGPVIPKGAKNVQLAKEFIKYMLEPKVLNQYLKGGLGRWMLPVPELANTDPFWFQQDPHRAAHGRLTLLGPTVPIYEIYNPAAARFNADHAFSIAEYDVMKEGMTPEAAIDKAFKRADEIFAKYPITQA